MAANNFSGPENRKKRKLLYIIVDELVTDELIENSAVSTSQYNKKNKIGALFMATTLTTTKPRSTPVRITDYVESIVPFYTEKDFKSHFRMSRTAVDELINIYGTAVASEKMYITISIQKRILVSLWLLATPESFRSIGDRFDLSKGNAHYVFIEFVRIVSKLRQIYITWPTEATMNTTMTVCETKYGFPGTIGAVDGCHIDIKEPNADKNSYYNRKKRTSILLQGICNETLLLIDCCAGWPGSVHDARMWRSSSIYECLKNGTRDVSNGHLLGDSAYPLDMFLLTPYKENGHRTNQEIWYNTRHSSARQMIERAFALLKGRFRRLKYLEMSLLAEISEVIMTACILHNFILRHDGDDDVGDYIDENFDNVTAEIVQEANNVNADAAKAKRNEIARNIRPLRELLT